MIRCIIIEDEPPARKVLAKYINDVPYLELTGQYANAMKAIEDIEEKEVDLMFLDINLPKISGLNFLRSLDDPPRVIITTAYSEYALEGFELNVIDYLLKPISFERFLKAVSKVHKSITSDKPLLKKEKTVDEKSDKYSFTFIKSDNTFYKIDFNEILFIESDEDYVWIHTNNEKHHLRYTLKYWDEKLPDELFVRVHKSFIVNLSKIKHISGNKIIMAETSIPVGRSYKKELFERVEDLM